MFVLLVFTQVFLLTVITMDLMVLITAWCCRTTVESTTVNLDDDDN